VDNFISKLLSVTDAFNAGLDQFLVHAFLKKTNAAYVFAVVSVVDFGKRNEISVFIDGWENSVTGSRRRDSGVQVNPKIH